MAGSSQFSNSAQQEDTSVTTTISSSSSPEAWLLLPTELRCLIYELIWGSKEVNCCGCAVTLCEYGCAVRCVNKCPARDRLCSQDIPSLINPRLNLLLVDRSVYHDVMSIPQQPLSGAFHGLVCAQNRLFQSTPAFLRALSQVRLQRKRVVVPHTMTRALARVHLVQKNDVYNFEELLGQCYEEVKACDPQISTTKHELPVLRHDPNSQSGENFKTETIVDIETVFELKAYKGFNMTEVMAP